MNGENGEQVTKTSQDPLVHRIFHQAKPKIVGYFRGVRNVFDQYKQNENRLTHALASALHNDEALLRDFLKTFVGKHVAPAKAHAVKVTEQTYPGSSSLSDDDASRKGIPDIWLYDLDRRWCAVVECKITSTLSADQIRRHLQTAQKRGFDRVIPVTITVSPIKTSLPSGTVQILWSALFEWLNDFRTEQPRTEQPWSRLAASYFEVLEGRMIEEKQLTEGKLTKFNGFPFTEPEAYSYLEAKRVLGLAMDELRNHQKLVKATRMNPKLKGRSAITGQNEDNVWDFLKTDVASDSTPHTQHVHLTLSVERRFLEAKVTIPNGLDALSRRRLKDLGIVGFSKLLQQIEKKLRGVKEPSGTPSIYVVQRRYPSQKSTPFIDAILYADLRTALESDTDIKLQPQWITAAYEALANKNSNLQMGIGMVFRYDRCQSMASAGALNLIAETWIAASQIIDTIHPKY